MHGVGSGKGNCSVNVSVALLHLQTGANTEDQFHFSGHHPAAVWRREADRQDARRVVYLP